MTDFINLTIYFVGLLTIIEIIVRMTLKILKWLISNDEVTVAEND